jgi:hypothetical protein
MPGKIKRMIDEIVRQRTALNPMFAGMVKTKLLLKGIDPSRYDANSPDDAAVIQKVAAAGVEMHVVLK